MRIDVHERGIVGAQPALDDLERRWRERFPHIDASQEA